MTTTMGPCEAEAIERGESERVIRDARSFDVLDEHINGMAERLDRLLLHARGMEDIHEALDLVAEPHNQRVDLLERVPYEIGEAGT